MGEAPKVARLMLEDGRGVLAQDEPGGFIFVVHSSCQPGAAPRMP